MATLDFQKVTKRYPDDTLALKDFDLKISDGELIVLIAPSGYGKSTALRLLVGLESVTDGKILINGNVSPWDGPL
nr:ATP-binding cassette domain-containing protein [Desulfogranum marinum]